MIQLPRFVPAASLILILLSCQRVQDERSDKLGAPDSTRSQVVSSSAAAENGSDSTRKFIRTADLKFRVKDVVGATYDIENIVRNQGGFVTFTNLASNIDRTTTVAVSADSSLETAYFTTENSMTFRVPNTRLDSTLNEIARNIQYLDHRIIKAEDVGLNILSNQLLQVRSVNGEKRITEAIDNKGKKLNETMLAEGARQSEQERSDNNKIATLSLYDQINYSTVNLFFYEKQSVEKEFMLSDKAVTEYKPGFGSQLMESIRYGWEAIGALIIFLMRFWAVILICFLGYCIYKANQHKHEP